MGRSAQLLGLPEELLLDIMRLLDPTSMQCLRRADRIFLRLFSDMKFSHLHPSVSALGNTQSRPLFPWQHGSPEFDKKAYDKPSGFRYLMHLDDTRKQCVPCRNANVENPRKAWDLVHEYLFCDACLVDHPIAFFSAAERKPWKRVRTCTGHTGYIRLCEHEVISRDDVARVWAAVLELDPAACAAGDEYVEIKRCRHPSHHMSGGRPSHMAGVDWLMGDEEEEVEEDEWERSCPKAMLSLDGAGAVVLGIEWVCHFRLPVGIEEVSKEKLASCLGEARRGVGEFLAPQPGPGMIPEMRCFDPNKCGCLDYGEDRYPANSKWAGMPRLNGEKGCRSDPAQRLFPMRLAAGQVATGDGEEEPRSSWAIGNGAHGALTYLSTAFGGRSAWCVEVDHCPVEDPDPEIREPCLRVAYSRSVICGPTWQRLWRTVDYSWFEALDPDSYQLWEDNDTKGVLWCLDSKCPNYYRYSGRPIVRKICVSSRAVVSGRPAKHSWRIKGVPFNVQDKDSILAEQARVADEQARVVDEKTQLWGGPGGPTGFFDFMMRGPVY
ncbi:hypothetical protein B0T16DRAFT_213244 [Cercophora newfieldiana]|uniref:F-box domain-containing protein n=1 Tax=Cercophora newfieldiana TaxID=92897 RepID=A0AA40CKY6_9PEZI|nr:hypothetical protein B0T16DRAFT_213244 [Cercophora newfieldiana]